MAVALFTKSAVLSCRTEATKDPFSYFVYSICMRRARSTVSKISPHLHRGGKILDIGLGSGAVTCILTKAGEKVESVDVQNASMFRDIQPRIYDGKKLPFRKKQFDYALLLFVLHHCDDQEQVLREAKRVAKHIVIIEDTYRNPLEKFVVGLNDAIGNWEFYGHAYRSTQEWKKLFRREKLKLLKLEEWTECLPSVWLYGRYSMYVLKTPTAD